MREYKRTIREITEEFCDIITFECSDDELFSSIKTCVEGLLASGEELRGERYVAFRLFIKLGLLKWKEDKFHRFDLTVGEFCENCTIYYYV